MEDRRKGRLKPYAWALGLLWGVPAIAALILWLTLPHQPPPGSCDNHAVFCSLSLADGVVLYGTIAAPFLFVAGLVAVLLISLIQLRRKS